MNDVQRADLDAANRGVVFNENPDVPTGAITDADLAEIMHDIVGQIEKVNTAESKQQHDYGTVSTDKEALKLLMGETVIRFALRGKTRAERLGLITLASELDHPVTFLTHDDATISITRATDMKDVMKAKIGPLGPFTNISADEILEMEDTITKFTAIKEQPTANVKEKKALGTDIIQPEIDLLNGFILQEHNLLHSYWDGTDNEKFANEFDLQTHAVVLGKRHNIAEVILLKDEDGKELKGGLVTCLKNNKTSDGANTNVYEIVGIPVGLQSFKAEAPGRVMVDFDIAIKRGKKVEMVVRMKLI